MPRDKIKTWQKRFTDHYAGAKMRKWKRWECRACDGCGWYEGGISIQTKCDECNGKGWYRGHPTTGVPIKILESKTDLKTETADYINSICFHLKQIRLALNEHSSINLASATMNTAAALQRLKELRVVFDWEKFKSPPRTNTDLPRELR